MAKADADNKKIQMVDIARLAGVSTSTVSRALNGSPLINEETRQRIADLAKSLSYTINLSAKNLRSGENRTIGVVIPYQDRIRQDVTDPFFMTMLGHLADQLTKQNFDLLFSRMSADRLEDLAQLYESGRVGGLIVVGQWDQHEKLNDLARRQIPFVVWGGQLPRQLYCTVGGDNFNGGFLAANHLLSLGRKRIVFMGDKHATETQQRYAGYVQAHQAHKVPIAPELYMAFGISGAVQGMFGSVAVGSSRLVRGLREATGAVTGMQVAEPFAYMADANRTHGLEMSQLALQGIIGGIGLGLGYISPVSTLIKWFPDRRGMATGMAIMGFGGGAMIGSPLAAELMKHFASAQGVGVWQTFVALAVIYFVFMMAGALTYRIPPSGWKPAGWTMPAAQASNAMITQGHVHVSKVWGIPQFWLVWIVLCMNVSAGIGVIGMASPMLQEMFGGSLIGSETKFSALTAEQLAQIGIVAAGFTALISLFNIGGRFVWASLSDKLGRKATYFVFFVLGLQDAILVNRSRATRCGNDLHVFINYLDITRTHIRLFGASETSCKDVFAM